MSFVPFAIYETPKPVTRCHSPLNCNLKQKNNTQTVTSHRTAIPLAIEGFKQIVEPNTFHQFHATTLPVSPCLHCRKNFVVVNGSFALKTTTLPFSFTFALPRLNFRRFSISASSQDTPGIQKWCTEGKSC